MQFQLILEYLAFGLWLVDTSLICSQFSVEKIAPPKCSLEGAYTLTGDTTAVL